MFNFSPRSRDTLTREFLIREGITHAKDAKPRLRSGRRRGTGRKIGYWGLDNGDWVEGGGWPYYAANPLRGAAPKGAR